MRRLAAALMAIGVLGTAGSAQAAVLAGSEPPRLDTLVVDATVQALATVHGRLYLGGSFGYLGRRTGPFATFDRSGRRLNRRARPLEGEVAAIAADGRGGFFAAGSLGAFADRQPSLPVVHLRADGSVDRAFRSALRGRASAVAADGRHLYVAGFFAGRRGGAHVVRLDAASGRVDPAFELTLRPVPLAMPSIPPFPPPPASTPCAGLPSWRYGDLARVPGVVGALLVHGGRVFVGGAFSHANGRPRGGLAALDTSSGRLDESVGTVAPNGVVTSLAVAGGQLLVGGHLTQPGSPRSSVVALDLTTGAPDPRFDSGPLGWVTSLVADDERVYVGLGIGYGRPPGIVALERLSGAPVRAFRDAEMRGVRDLALDRGRLYAVGTLEIPPQNPREVLSGIGILDPGTGRVRSFLTLTDSTPGAIEIDGARIALGGAFRSAGGIRRPGLAAFRADGTYLGGFRPRGVDLVTGLVAGHGRLYASGNFEPIAGTSRGGGRLVRRYTGLAAFDPVSGTRMRHFRPPSRSGGGSAFALAGRRLYAVDFWGGGLRSFDAVSGRPDRDFRPAVTEQVLTLAASGRRLYVGGALTGRGRTTGLVALDRVSGRRARTFRPDRAVGRGGRVVVGAIALAYGRLFVGSRREDTAGGSEPARVAALDPWSGRAIPAFRGPRIDAHRLAVAGGRLLVAGDAETRGVFELDPRTGGSRPGFAGGVPGDVCAVAAAGRRLYAGGNFHPPGRALPPFFAPLR